MGLCVGVGVVVVLFCFFKETPKPRVVVQIYNASVWEAEVGGSGVHVILRESENQQTCLKQTQTQNKNKNQNRRLIGNLIVDKHEISKWKNKKDYDIKKQNNQTINYQPQSQAGWHSASLQTGDPPASECWDCRCSHCQVRLSVGQFVTGTQFTLVWWGECQEGGCL